MKYIPPVLDYSESDLEVAVPHHRDFKVGDLVILQSSVRWTNYRQPDPIGSILQKAKRKASPQFDDIEWDEVGVVINIEIGNFWTEVIWCRAGRFRIHSPRELSIVTRA